jgi:hypothetical protein
VAEEMNKQKRRTSRTIVQNALAKKANKSNAVPRFGGRQSMTLTVKDLSFSPFEIEGG